MSSEPIESFSRFRSNNHSSAEQADDFSDQETHNPTHNSSINVVSKPAAPIPSLQSTVKVEGRKENTVDRFKICPLLLRVFFTYGRHHNPLDYKKKEFPKNELQIHTWMDATLSEILINLQQKNRKVRRNGTVVKFQIISPDPVRPRYKARDIGSIKVNYKGPDDYKTLSQCRFMIGDFIDLCIKLPKN